MSVFNSQILQGTAMTVISVLFHVAGLVLLAAFLRRITLRMSWLNTILQTMCLLTLGLLAIIALHMIEALAWAVLYIHLDEFQNLTDALYFSVTTSTTMGYGDLTLSPQWRLLSTFEAIAGLLLFGASTAFLLGLMKRLFEEVAIEAA